MSVYNSERYLEEAIESVINQTFSDFELIIVNDGSTDSSVDIIKGFGASDDRIVVVQQSNTGLTRALIKAAEFARGQYLARQDADDVSLPNRFERQLEILEQTRDALVFCPVQIIDDKSNILCNIYPPINESEIRTNFLRLINPIAHGSIMLRRDILVDSGSYCADVYKGQDYELYLRLLGKARFLRANEPLYQLRIHNETMSYEPYISKINRIPRILYNKAALAAYQDDYRYSYDVYLKQVCSAEHQLLSMTPPVEYFLSLYQLIGGSRRKSIHQALKSVRKNPLYWKQYVLFLLTFLPSSFINRVLRIKLPYLMHKN
jgi:glycosyltransferase involved in cell wall biosynthesis